MSFPIAGPNYLHPSKQAHLARVAASRARLEAFNHRVTINQILGKERALQLAAARFLPAGETLTSPRHLDLAQWPYSGTDKHPYNVPFAKRAQVLKDDAVCVWCRLNPSTTIDHVRPLSRGGSNHPLNLVGACEPCNSAKSDFMPRELGWVMRLPLRAFALEVIVGGTKPGGWVQISIFTAVICVIAAVSAMTARESAKVPTAELGLHK